MEDYTSLSMVGKGACGSVYLVRHNHSKKLFALKKIQLDESRKTRTKAAVLREAKILSSLKHPNIVTYHDSFFDEKEEYLCIIQDYCDGGTLEDIIKDAEEKQTYLPEKEIIQWFLQIAMAVRYMHSMKVLHRDLKASNVFMNKSGTLCKIGDFGIAKSMETLEVASTCVGTPCYLSPEMCQDIPYSSKADVWAMGCMLYEMLALKPAFDANNLVSLFYKIVKGEFDALPDYYSCNLLGLVAAVLVKDPQDRPSARGVLAIPFLKMELLKFIEEKEWQLAQQRLPTRQGSRPYSTPNLARLGSFVGKEHKPSPGGTEDAAKRAISCRPNIINHKERSILISAKQSCRTPRVSTIVEETDEQMSGKLLDKDHLCSDSMPSPHSQSNKFVPVEEVTCKPDNADCEKVSPDQKVFPSHQNKNNHDGGSDDNLSDREDHRMESPAKNHSTHDVNDKEGSPSKVKHKTSYAKIDMSGFHDKDESETYRFSDRNQKGLSLDLSVPKDNLDFREFQSGRPRRNKIQEPMRTPRTLEPRVLIIQEEEPVKCQSLSTPSTPTQSMSAIQPAPTQSMSAVQPATPSQCMSPIQPAALSPNKKLTEKKPAQNGSSNNIKEPTAKIQVANESMNRKNKKKSPPKQQKKTDNSKRKMLPKADPKAGKKSPDAKVSPAGLGNGPAKNGCRAHDRQHQNSKVKGRGADTSDIEEEIPEEIPDCRRTSARSNSLTQTFEIPEIEEDLPDGLVAEDEDHFNDFEDQDIEEDLDEVVTVAKWACDDLESQEVTDEVVVDDRRPNTSRMIRHQCINELGREKYDTVRRFFENNDEPELRKIEKVVGKEHSKTIYLMTEIAQKKKLNHC